MQTLQIKTTAQALTLMDRFNSQAGGVTEDVEAQIKEIQRRAVQDIAKVQAQVKAHTTLRRAAIPPRFAERSFENFHPCCSGSEKALATASGYASDFAAAATTGRSLIFTGNVGTGKTHLATAIGNDVMKQGYSVYFLTVLEAVRLVKETFRRDSVKTESQALGELISPDLLVLDEVGVQYGSETEKQIFFEIINGRYMQMKPTILLGNTTIPEMEVLLGDRVMDRMREGGGGAVPFDWDSYRRQAQ